MENEIFDSVEAAFKEVMTQLKGEQISAIEIHWGHGTHTIVESATGNPEQPYKGWEIVEDA